MKKTSKTGNKIDLYWNEFVLFTAYLSGIFGIGIAVF